MEPLITFASFNLHTDLIQQIQAEGYTTPTPIQAKAIPIVLEGKDVMGLAQTGTGKTAAFVLPILQKLITGPRGILRALIIAPTRELAEQINTSIMSLSRKTGIKSATIYGGVGMRGQITALSRGVDIAVACPGRLLDHIQQRTISLSKLEFLVLDEADQMLDMGFLPTIKRILPHVPAHRQSLLFSATMPSDIRHLTQSILKNPVTIEVAHTQPVQTVTHAIFQVRSNLKTDFLLALLSKTATQSVLIFTRTKHRAKSIDRLLQKNGYKCASLQGNLSQSKRQAALNGFRDGTFDILVATDIAARGIDVTQVSHVINFDLPDTTEAYIHRIGRTGRASRTGDAFSIVCPDIEGDREMVRQIERKLGAPLETLTLDGFNYGQAASNVAKRTFERLPQGGAPHRSQNKKRRRPS